MRPRKCRKAFRCLLRQERWLLPHNGVMLRGSRIVSPGKESDDWGNTTHHDGAGYALYCLDSALRSGDIFYRFFNTNSCERTVFHFLFWFILLLIHRFPILSAVVIQRIPTDCRKASGLKYLRGQSINHRDLKFANILVVRAVDGSIRLKLCDFTYAKEMDPDVRNYDSFFVTPF